MSEEQTGTAGGRAEPGETIELVESGGDAACWANRVCPECGRLNDAERPVVCEACGAEFG